MADTGKLIWPCWRRNDFTRIVFYCILATAFIFIIDIITPLGVMIWILYFIPLFMTVYLSWKYAPLVMTGVIIILMAASLFLSPRDISLEFALLNRAFFALILIISSIFIEDYISNVEGLALSEARYRHLIEWSPQGIIVLDKGEIKYANPGGVRLFGTDSNEQLISRNIIEFIEPGWQEIFRQRLAQAAIGAQMDIDNVHFIRQDGSNVTLGMYLAPVIWNNVKMIQIVMRRT
jgi:PAS domain S-box-containing protein